jgi:hypothetical protein
VSEEIGVRELLEQLRSELLQEKPESLKLFFIEEAEIELNVAIKRETQGGIKIAVLQFGGLEAGASKGQEQGHKVRLKLKPLVTYKEARAALKESDHEKALEVVMRTGS